MLEITAFDELSIRMRLEDLTQTQVEFAFDYVRISDGVDETGGPGPAANRLHARAEHRHQADQGAGRVAGRAGRVRDGQWLAGSLAASAGAPAGCGHPSAPPGAVRRQGRPGQRRDAGVPGSEFAADPAETCASQTINFLPDKRLCLFEI